MTASGARSVVGSEVTAHGEGSLVGPEFPAEHSSLQLFLNTSRIG